MPLIVLGVLSAGVFGGLLLWGSKRKTAGSTSGATPFPTSEQGKTQT
jgi:hypothetical protein